jgi:hypothetical protein
MIGDVDALRLFRTVRPAPIRHRQGPAPQHAAPVRPSALMTMVGVMPELVPSRRALSLDPRGVLDAQFALRHLQIVMGLQVHPELGAVAEVEA